MHNCAMRLPRPPADRLPPLHALRAFEAAARHLHFGRAAEELRISQSAVSHHVRRLEADLGVRLFERRTRAVALTPAGEALLRDLGRAFALLAEGVRRARGAGTRRGLRVSLLSSFASNWLVPRLPRFAAAEPMIDLDLDPNLRVIDLEAGEADLAIRFGAGWEGLDCRLLLAERLSPVAAPGVFGGGAPEDLLAHPLLMSRRLYDWHTWADSAGLDLGAARTVMLSDYSLVIQAAEEGHGIAIGRLLLIGDRLRTGRLVEALPGRCVSHPKIGHWLVAPRRRRLSPEARAFAAWIVAEAAAASPTEDGPGTAEAPPSAETQQGKRGPMPSTARGAARA